MEPPTIVENVELVGPRFSIKDEICENTEENYNQEGDEAEDESKEDLLAISSLILLSSLQRGGRNYSRDHRGNTTSGGGHGDGGGGGGGGWLQDCPWRHHVTAALCFLGRKKCSDVSEVSLSGPAVSLTVTKKYLGNLQHRPGIRRHGRVICDMAGVKCWTTVI